MEDIKTMFRNDATALKLFDRLKVSLGNASTAIDGNGDEVAIRVNENPTLESYDLVLIGAESDPYFWPGDDTAEGWDDRDEYPEGVLCSELWEQCAAFWEARK